MKVFVVKFRHDESDSEGILGVFSSDKKADEFLASYMDSSFDAGLCVLTMEEFKLDAPFPVKAEEKKDSLGLFSLEDF